MFGRDKNKSSISVDRHGSGSYKLTVVWSGYNSKGQEQRTIYSYSTEEEKNRKIKEFKNKNTVREVHDGSVTK